MPLKPQNIVQAAEADMQRSMRNAEQAALAKYNAVSYEPYAFHRAHVRRARSAHELILLALMNPVMKTAKHNTKMIYGDGALLVQALRATG